MILKVNHTTTYRYGQPVSICHTEVHLTPRASARQTVLMHELTIEPAPDTRAARNDYFGNGVTAFSIHRPHRTLAITATSLVDRQAGDPIHPGLTPPWEQVRDEVRCHESDATFDAFQFIFESPRVKLGPAFAAYVEESFAAGRPLLEAARDLCRRIFTDFKYAQGATTVTTPVEEAFESRQGVCQDFAHIMIACLRSLGLPALYVSGCMRGSPDSIGAAASHAWVSVFSGSFGWLDFDPTNDLMPAGDHVTIAWGRDYSDVPPVKGVALGGGAQMIDVTVEVTPAT